MSVPPEFAADVELAAAGMEAGKLGLLAREANWFPWRDGALALVARKQAELSRKFPPEAVSQVILFTGHMIDAPGRSEPRFPPEQEDNARQAIFDAVRDLSGRALGIAGGACGGDILFHEVCAELGVPTRVLLTLPPGPFLVESVERGGPDWVRRFHNLIAARPVEVLGETMALPRWMRERAGYDVWQRTNLWLLEEALAILAPERTLVALWDGRRGDGPGGTEHLVELAGESGIARRIRSPLANAQGSVSDGTGQRAAGPRP